MSGINRLFFLILILSLALAACTGGQTPAAKPAAPAVVKIGWSSGPDSLNPAVAMLSKSYIIYESVYSALLELKLDGSYVPDLAESWTSNPEKTVHTFKLRQGVKFHDGKPLTAKDVVFSFNFYKSHEDFPYMNGYTTHFQSVEAPDDSTVVLTLDEAIPNLESQIVFLFILPEHIWAANSEGTKANEFENKEMIGSGAFKLKEYKQDEYVHLVVNKEYYGTVPKVDEVIFQIFKNQDSLVQAIKTGQVDMITEMPNTAAASLRQEKNIQLVIGAPFAPDITDVIINQLPADKCPEGSECNGHPALKDVKVRQALAHATNKQELIDVVLLGLGTPGLTLIPDSLGKFYNNKIQDFPFDLNKANQLLDEAGYKDTDGDGVRQMPDGSKPLTFRLNWSSESTITPRLAELLAKSWEKVGIKAQLQAYEPDTLSSICCPAFNYDILLWGWGSDPDPSFLLQVMTTDVIPDGTSETGYSNPEYDQLYLDQAKETDAKKRIDLVWKMQEIVHKDCAYIIPFYSKAVQAFRTDRFKGWITDQPKVSLDDISSLLVIEPAQ